MLADARATGALVVPGPQRGTVFLVEGRITYVEADDVPGLDARCARRARSDGRPEPIGAVTRSATLDAAVATLARPATAPARFHAGVTHPSGEVAPLGVDALLSAVAAGVDALSRAAVGPDDELTLLRAGKGGVRLVGRQLAVLAGFTEGATPRELAWRAGEAILDTVAAVGDLVAQGVCAVTTIRPRPLPAGGAPALTDGPAPSRVARANGAPPPPPAAPGSPARSVPGPPATRARPPAGAARSGPGPAVPVPPPPPPPPPPPGRPTETPAHGGGPPPTPGRGDEVALGPRQRPAPSRRAAGRRVVPRDIPGDAPPDAARAVTGPLAPLARAIEARASDDTGKGSGPTRRRPGGPPAPSSARRPGARRSSGRDPAPAADDLPQRTPRPMPPPRRTRSGWPAAFARPDHDVYVRLLDGLRRR
jgi:hypothetical protein